VLVGLKIIIILILIIIQAATFSKVVKHAERWPLNIRIECSGDPEHIEHIS